MSRDEVLFQVAWCASHADHIDVVRNVGDTGWSVSIHFPDGTKDGEALASFMKKRLDAAAESIRLIDEKAEDSGK